MEKPDDFDLLHTPIPLADMGQHLRKLGFIMNTQRLRREIWSGSIPAIKRGRFWAATAANVLPFADPIDPRP